MQGIKRKIVQAVSFEAIAFLMVTPAIAGFYGQSFSQSSRLALLLSLLAMAWNMLFNNLFERWEARQPDPNRTLGRRILHAIAFEGGLAMVLVPVIAWALEIAFVDALLADLGLVGFFLVYALVFQWGFDRAFGLPVRLEEAAACRL